MGLDRAAVDTEGSCLWFVGLFVIIKHFSAMYTMVYKCMCSGLQNAARFLLPQEHMAQI